MKYFSNEDCAVKQNWGSPSTPNVKTKILFYKHIRTKITWKREPEVIQEKPEDRKTWQ